MVTFICMADRNRVFEGGPYFYNQVGLFVKHGMQALILLRNFQIRFLYGLGYPDFL